MSLLNFPSNPNPGDTWTIGNKTYVWSGAAWLISSTNSLTVGVTTVTSTINSISTDTGALVVAGGVGIGGDLWLGGVLYINSQAVLTTASFAYSINEGEDIAIDINSSTGALIFSDISTLQSVTTRGPTTNRAIQITNATASSSTGTGALIVRGGVGIGNNAYIEGRVDCESVKIEDAVFDSTLVNLTLNSTAVIDTYSLTQYRAAKYFVQISEGTGPSAHFQAQEITVIASNTGTADISVYGTVTTNGPTGLGQFDAVVSGSDVQLRFTPDFATQKTVKVLRTALTV